MNKDDVLTEITKAAERTHGKTPEQRFAKAITPEAYDQYLAADADTPTVEYMKVAPDSFDRIETLSKRIADESGCTPEFAAAEILKAHPELYDQYLAEPNQRVEKIENMAGVSSVEPVEKVSRADMRKQARERARATARRIQDER